MQPHSASAIERGPRSETKLREVLVAPPRPGEAPFHPLYSIVPERPELTAAVHTPIESGIVMRELVNTVRQALALLNAPFRRRWILQVPWALLSAALEMIATAGMLILIRLISDPAA